MLEPLDVVIIGAGKLGALVHDCLDGDDRWNCTAFHDDHQAGGILHGLPILGMGCDALRPGQRAILAVGDPSARRALVERLNPRGLDWQTFVDRRSVVGREAELGRGTIVLSFAMIASSVKLGSFCFIYAYARVGTGSEIGAYTSVLTGASVGESSIGEECLLGLNSACLGGAVLANRVTVAPMTLVRRPVPAGALVAGYPARVFQRASARASISLGRE